MEIDVDAVIDDDGLYRLTITSAAGHGAVTAIAARVGDAREVARDAARRHWGPTDEVVTGHARLVRPNVGPDGQFVQTAAGEIGTALWWAAEWSWLVTTPTSAGMSATEDLHFGYEPGPAERAELEDWLDRRRRNDEERRAGFGRSVLAAERDGFAARVAEVAAAHPGRPLWVGLHAYVADAVDAAELARLSPEGVTVTVYAVPEARAWDIKIDPA